MEKQDKQRLAKQLNGVLHHMRRKRWQTLTEIEYGTGYPQASISARLREIRNSLGYRVEKKRVKLGGGQYTYRVMP